jgi:putative ABC transport system permease protein
MIGHYFRSALRNFRRRPLSTAIKLLVLALGFACCLTANLIAGYVQRTDRQWAHADSIYSIWQAVTPPGAAKESSPTIGAISGSAVEYLKVDFPDVIIAATNTLPLSVRANGTQEDYNVLVVDPEFFRIFDLKVSGGSAEALSAPHSVLLEAAAARQLFGTADAAGQTLQVGRGDATVAGIFELPMPTHLGSGNIGKKIRVIMPRAAVTDVLGFNLSYPPIWSTTCCTTYLFRPQGGPTVAELQARLERFSETRVPPEFGRVRFGLMSLGDMGRAYLNLGLFGGSFDLSIVTILNAFAALILAVACVDFANLAIAESAARSREIGVRKTMGASRGQVVMQSLFEVGLLSLVALALVLPLTLLVVTPLAGAIGLEITAADFLGRSRYWLGVFGIAVAVCVVAGVYPALVLARVRPISSLRMTGAHGGAATVRTALIVVQFATASFLLVAVAVMLQQKGALRDRLADPSRDPRLAVTVGQTGPGFDLSTFRSQLLANPAVSGFTASASEPFRRAYVTGIPPATIARSEDPAAKRIPIQQRYVYYDYFDVAGIRLLAGRDFDQARDIARPDPPPDETSPAAGVAPVLHVATQHVIIDEKLASRLGLTAQQAIGEMLYEPTQILVPGKSGAPAQPTSVTLPLEVVGVVAATPLEYMAEGPDSYLYFVQPGAANTLILRIARGDIPGALTYIDATWRKFFPNRQLRRAFLDEAFDTNFRMFDMLGTTFVGLSVIAIAIAAMGLFGIASFVVQRRQREIGIRKTMGATKARVLRLVLWEFSKLVLLANAIAWPLAWLAARTYLNLFVQRIELSLMPFALALGITLLIACTAVATHALRAARVKPALVLKAD